MAGSWLGSRGGMIFLGACTVTAMRPMPVFPDPSVAVYVTR